MSDSGTEQGYDQGNKPAIRPDGPVGAIADTSRGESRKRGCRGQLPGVIAVRSADCRGAAGGGRRTGSATRTAEQVRALLVLGRPAQASGIHIGTPAETMICRSVVR